jgi:hypothetical protein
MTMVTKDRIVVWRFLFVRIISDFCWESFMWCELNWTCVVNRILWKNMLWITSYEKMVDVSIDFVKTCVNWCLWWN